MYWSILGIYGIAWVDAWYVGVRGGMWWMSNFILPSMLPPTYFTFKGEIIFSTLPAALVVFPLGLDATRLPNIRLKYYIKIIPIALLLMGEVVYK